MTRKPGILLLILSLLILTCLSMIVGSVPLSLTKALGDIISNTESIESLIMLEVRLPRTLLAVLIGSALGMSGAALQGLLRNPLASPDLLGISQTASLGAVVTLYFGLAASAWIILPLSAMVGAFCAVLLIMVLAGKTPGLFSIILVGIALNAMMNALIAVALNMAPNPYALQEIYFWMLGAISNRSLQETAFAFPFLALGMGLIYSTRYYLNALSLGDNTAQSLGFDKRKYTWFVITGVACCTGASVAVSGNIAFVGLLIPHLLRPLAQHEPGKLLGLSAIGGAVLLLLADLVVRLLPGTNELQLGVITSALGGPFFLYLVFQHRGRS